MGFYEIRDSNDNVLASNVWIDDDMCSGGRGSVDFFTIPATLLYFLGFFGVGSMMFNLPSHFVFIGIISAILYALPLLFVLLALLLKQFIKKDDTVVGEPFDEEEEPFTLKLYHLLTDGGGIFKNIFKKFLAPFAYILFNVFIGMFWICYPLGSISEATLVGIIIPCAYSMYYYPYILITNACKRKSKALGVVSAAIIVGSLAVFLINYDSFAATDSFIGLALFFTMITVLGTLAILISNVILSTKKSKRAILLVLYLLLAALVAYTSLAIIPQHNEERYNEAVECVENGDYRKARELFLDLGRYKDSEEKYNEIRFTNLVVGEKIIMGSQTDSPDSLSGDNPLSWTVIAVDGNRALILSDAILTSIDSGSISQWNKGCAVRNALNNIEGLFTESEIARAIEYSYKINAGGSTVQASDKLFLLSKAELEAYCSKEEIFIKKDTKYNDHQVLGYQMADFDYEYKYSFYVRDTNAAGEWIIADCEAEQFVTKDNKYVGIRPAMFITMDRASG